MALSSLVSGQCETGAGYGIILGLKQSLASIVGLDSRLPLSHFGPHKVSRDIRKS